MQQKTIIILSTLILLALTVTAILFFFNNKKEVTVPIVIENGGATENKIKIVAFGDSLTAGYGVDLKDSYPTILQERLNQENKMVEVVNMGVSGETTSGGLDRVQFVIDQKPNIVLLGLGANDMLRSSSPALARSNLEKIIQALKAANITVVLLGMQSIASNGEVYKKEFNSIYPDLAKKYDVPLVKFFLEGVALQDSLNTADGIHPNRAGYEIIVDKNILPVLLPILK